MASNVCKICGQKHQSSLMSDRATPPYCSSCLVAWDEIRLAASAGIAGHEVTTQTTAPSVGPEVLGLLKRIAESQADIAHNARITMRGVIALCVWFIIAPSILLLVLALRNL